MPLTGIMQNYFDIPYTKAITIVFPYWLESVYNSSTVFKSYFRDIFGADVSGKSDDEILAEGLDRIWETYRQLGVATRFSELSQKALDKESLRAMIAGVEEMYAMFGTFDSDSFERILIDSIG